MDVFLSSTVQDLKEYRLRVRDALRVSSIHCELGEEWSGSYGSTVDLVSSKLHQSRSYYGIFAHYYGSVPPGRSESITIMEFRWAQKRWGQDRPPRIAIFVPRRGSTADGKLKDLARQLLADKFQKQPEEQERLFQLQERFVTEVMSPTDEWKMVNQFEDVIHLGDLALHVHSVWEKELLKAANGGRAHREPSPDELGRLGREEHLMAAGRAIDGLKARNQPALVLMAAGHEDAGQGELVRAVGAQVLVLGKRFRMREGSRPPFDRFGLDDLIRWLASVVGQGEATTVEELAAVVARAGKEKPIALMIDPLDSFEGGAQAFQARFWAPFYQRLAADPLIRRPCFALVAASYRPLPAVETSFSTAAKPGADPSKLLVLPALDDLDELAVIGWLSGLDVPDDTGNRHLQIAKAVFQRGDETLDGTPQRVFRRLGRQVLWPNGE
jgi:hypothetical protein